MVKFGERLPGMMRQGWEEYYINYEGLKSIIEAIELAPANQNQMSEDFLARATAEVSKVDSFVAREENAIRKRLEQSVTVTDVRKIEDALANLRHFVGTNVIAATKIVKKHDKHVAPDRRKRDAVAELVRNCTGLSALQLLHVEVAARLPAPTGQQAAPQRSVSLTLHDDDDSEQGLRSLPAWLLQGAEEFEAEMGKARLDAASASFYATYLQDWSLRMICKADDGYEMASLIGSHGAKPSTDEDDAKWAVQFESDAKPWASLTTQEKAKALLVVMLKVAIILGALYAFICSLSFLADGFRLVAGKRAGEIFRTSEIFNNPIAGMLVGVLVTVLVQSSSTSTSIIITMVAADLFTVRQAIALIMGANIGTSVTSTLVALAQAGDRNEFRRAFAAATVHDMFNFLSVLVFLPLESATSYLFKVSEALINATPGLSKGSKPPDILKALTKPFTSKVIKIDKKLITQIAVADASELAALENKAMLKHFFSWGPEDLSDGAAGGIILVAALLILCTTLFAIVWTLKSLLKGRVAVWLHRSVNGDFPDLKCGRMTIPLGWLSGYVAMLVGLIVTICVQSSSITTSALTPLVGIGVISVDRMYPTVLGANIGTCVTGVLAALAADSSKLYLTLQVAYSHLLFNLSGILIFYVCWPLRPLPIRAAKHLGETTATYRWFALVYLLMCFFLVPCIFMGLSLWGTAPAIIAAVLVVGGAAFVSVVNVLQARRPAALPTKLRSWAFLPEALRSLAPLDRVICMPLGQAIASCCPCCRKMCGDVAAKPRVTVREGVSSTTASDLEIAAQRISMGASASV